MSTENDSTTVYEYLKDTVCDSWGIDPQKQLESEGKEGQTLLRLIKTSFVSRVRNINQESRAEDDGYDSWLKETVHIEFSNKYHYILEIKVYYGDGTPGCCASYYFTHDLNKHGKCESDSESS